jgi:asparagine synthase (glutamine-hydrolysing)
MCGITGAISLNHKPLKADRLKPMVDIIAHRGPDDAGYLVWQTGVHHSRGYAYGQDFTDRQFQAICPLLPVIDSPSGREMLESDNWDVFFGHRRLSIIDLTPRGHQPMCDKPREIWLIYNGEIYNFREIRQELQSLGYVFFSNSDTEIIIHAYRAWGTDCIHRFNGMFAFALYDDRKKKIWLARDRYGIKPLYYTVTHDGTLLFGSEIRSILRYLPATPEVDLAALNEYFSFQNIFSDRTLFADIKLLPPGHYIWVDLAHNSKEVTRCVVPRRYWDFDFSQELDTPEHELEDQLYELVVQAVKRQCISDVPIGSYLSGGLDSGSITAIAASVWGRIATFTGGFDLSEAAQHEQSFDERELAEYMANLFQTEHYECVLHSGDMEAIMKDLIWHLEDLRVGQCYQNFYIARLASKFTKVVLAGTGGDELFGGYPWRYAAAIGNGTESYTDNYYHYWQRLVSNQDKSRLFNQDVVDRLRQMNIDGMLPLRDHTLKVFRNVYPREIICNNRSEQVNNSLYFECKTFLHGLFVIEDKISMAHSLETRVPFLDNDLVNFACQVPVHYKIADLHNLKAFDENFPLKMKIRLERMDIGKNILRKTMGRIIPEQIARAKKQGFSAPDESWFRGRSEKYVRDILLNDQALINEYLNHEYVKRAIDLHSSGSVNKRLLIWSLLSFEWWLRIFMDPGK